MRVLVECANLDGSRFLRMEWEEQERVLGVQCKDMRIAFSTDQIKLRAIRENFDVVSQAFTCSCDGGVTYNILELRCDT